jgi:hypothetical protein
VTVWPGDADSHGRAKYTAEVVFSDPDLGREAASRIIFTCRAFGLDFVIFPAAIPVPASRACRPAVERKVVVSWARSTCRVYLTYNEKREARTVVDQFKAGQNRILGCRVGFKCIRKEHPGFTVVLEEVLSEATEADVYAAIPFDYWPERVEMGIPTYYPESPDDACGAVENMLYMSGGLQRFERQATSASTQFKVEARFVDEAHARRAVAAVDDKLLLAEEVRMSARIVASAEFKIDERVADTLHFQERLNTQTTVWEAALVETLSRRRDGYLFLELQGPDCRAVARAKAWLERVLEGEEEATLVKQHTAPVPADTAERDCAVCFTPAERPIQTSCGHVYCTACFAAACDPEALSASASAITCLGDGNTCGTAFPLAELRSLLPPATVEGILAASFDRYIAKDPASFRYCPTPDCGHIYRPHHREVSSVPGQPSPPPREHLCPGCLATFCTACHAAHPDLSCSDYQDVSSGRREAVDRLKAELGVKDCTRCGTSIERTEGCNHVTCRGCGAHLCWICLAFATATACYDHLIHDHHRRVFDPENLAQLMQEAGIDDGAGGNDDAGGNDGEGGNDDDEDDEDDEEDPWAPGEVLFRV